VIRRFHPLEHHFQDRVELPDDHKRAALELIAAR
jgi:hypothetical protein